MVAAEAQAALDEANSGTKRLSSREILAIAGAASEARKAADAKMERFLELDELITQADA